MASEGNGVKLSMPFMFRPRLECWADSDADNAIEPWIRIRTDIAHKGYVVRAFRPNWIKSTIITTIIVLHCTRTQQQICQQIALHCLPLPPMAFHWLSIGSAADGEPELHPLASLTSTRDAPDVSPMPNKSVKYRQKSETWLQFNQILVTFTSNRYSASIVSVNTQ